MSPAPPRAFISYSHDSAEHDERVRALADRLCGDGVDCTIDQYDPHPREPWPRWMDRQIEEADFVLVVCTPTYLRRTKGSEPPGVGLGVTFESVLIIQDLYDAGMWNEKFVPVLFDGASPRSIPKPLRSYTHFRLDAGYESLLRHLRNEPRVRRPEVQPGVPLPPAASLKPSPQYRCMAQPPEGWIHRQEYDEVLEALCSKEGAQAGRSVGITTALRGAGGFGKTALAQKLCFDERVRETYPDGILWATMGEEADSNSRLREIRLRGEDASDVGPGEWPDPPSLRRKHGLRQRGGGVGRPSRRLGL
jgi:SEFIR domain